LPQRLAVVAKLNKPQRLQPKSRQTTAVAKPVVASGRHSFSTSQARSTAKPWSLAPSKAGDAMVGSATSNVVRLATATKPHTRDIRRYGIAA
jgi:hypothetical protein